MTMTTDRPLKDPVPDRACGTCLVAIYAAGSPDRDAQVASFDRDHPEGPRHVRVARLPADHGDVRWGWTPGCGLPFPGGRDGALGMNTASAPRADGGRGPSNATLAARAVHARPRSAAKTARP